MDQVQTLQLPSGRLVKFRRPGILELYRAKESLPDLSLTGAEADDTPAVDDQEFSRAGILLIVGCCVEPRFWVDLRPDFERLREPLECPATRTELDLSVGDFTALTNALSALIQEERENIGPLSATAPA